MKTYKLLKELKDIKKGTTFEYSKEGACSTLNQLDDKNTSSTYLVESGLLSLVGLFGINNTEFFEETKTKNKFKIGDYTIWEGEGLTTYLKIISIDFSKELGTVYNATITDVNRGDIHYYKEDKLRKPIQQELDLYFR